MNKSAKIKNYFGKFFSKEDGVVSTELVIGIAVVASLMIAVFVIANVVLPQTFETTIQNVADAVART